MKRSQSDTSDKMDLAWICQACTFQNHPSILQCEICGTQKTIVKTQDKIVEEKKSDFSCHACKHNLQKLVSKCPNCAQILIPPSDSQEEEKEGKPLKKDQKQKQYIKCPSCSQDNDKDNETCVFCQEYLNQKEVPLIPIKKRAYRKSRAYRGWSFAPCRFCGMTMISSSLALHEQTCTKMNAQDLESKYLLVQKKYCEFCYQKMKPEQYDAHQKTCSSRQQFYSESSPTYQRCSKLQKQTILYMHNKSQKLHWIAEQSLIKRIVSLGYKSSDLENLHHYIVNYAPIIIHMHVNTHMQFFVKDTHYRNQFETKKSSGSLSQSSRTSWENRMFDNKHHYATPFERVKYGTINFTNDPKGVRACVGYGQSYFLLKSHVRNRCTVTDMDSSSPSATIATFQFCFHLLNKLSDAELKAAFEGSKANEVESICIGAYKEIQIHGPVQFKEDIERVYVNKAELADLAHLQLVKNFCKKNNLEYEVFGAEPPKPGSFGFASTYYGSSLFSPPALPASGGFPFGVPAATTSIFARPAIKPSTAHLLGGSARRRPEVSKIKEDEQLQQGVDYI